MAKRQRRTRTASLVVTSPAAPATSCKLREIPASPDFEAATGATVKLITHDHVGAVLIAKAEYDGKQLIPAGQALAEITLTTLPGRHTLKMVFVFSASITGQGELREDCGGGESHFLRALTGDEPFQILRIVGR
jgi:hypothetical protein